MSHSFPITNDTTLQVSYGGVLPTAPNTVRLWNVGLDVAGWAYEYRSVGATFGMQMPEPVARARVASAVLAQLLRGTPAGLARDWHPQVADWVTSHREAVAAAYEQVTGEAWRRPWDTGMPAGLLLRADVASLANQAARAPAAVKPRPAPRMRGRSR